MTLHRRRHPRTLPGDRTTRSGPTSARPATPSGGGPWPSKYGTEAAIGRPEVRDLVERIINTGAEYEKTSDQYLHGIRSTPTMIINNRMIIGTLPYQHLKAIFQALVDERESGGRKFIENWVPVPKKALKTVK